MNRRIVNGDRARALREVTRRFVRPPLRPRNVALFFGSVLVSALVVAFLWDGELSREATLMAGIFVLAALLWVTAALPLFATALLVIGLETVLLANPGGWPGLGFEGGESPDYQEFFAPLASPIIILFLGGFLMARAAVKEGVDRALAGVILGFFRGRPRRVMLGLMLVTATFSMFVSNTATTAMMIALVAPMVARIEKGAPIRKGLVLSVPFAANIGGMGTPIASPPNAVAVGFLRSAGVEISFLQWMLISVPLMAGLLLLSWLLLGTLYRNRDPNLRLETEGQAVDGRGWFVIGVILLTITLWLTEAVHGLPTAVVALFPAVVFTATGMLGRRDFDSLQWHILFLIAGGIALGLGMQRTGLDAFLADQIPTGARLALVALALATLVFSTFMSNTAAANLFIPIGVSLATASAAGPGPLELAIPIALAASVAMALPVSTPPNAIAFARDEFKIRDMVVSGGIIGLLAVTLIVAFASLVINFWL